MEEFKYSGIDVDAASVEEIEAAIERLQGMHTFYKNEEQAQKILMNSMYGALGNGACAIYNTNVASSVTLMGQAQNKYMRELVDDYFLNHYHMDSELHQFLEIDTPPKVQESTIIYGDTDSAYISFDEMYSNSGTTLEPHIFFLKIYNYRLIELIEQGLQDFAKLSNAPYLNPKGKPYQEFELEQIIRNSIFMDAKKKYVLDPCYTPGKKLKNGWLDIESGVFHTPLSKMKVTGLEIVRGETPPFCKDKLKFLLKEILSKGDSLKYDEVINILVEYRNQYRVAPIDSITSHRGCNKMTNYILNDVTDFVYAAKSSPTVRGAGYYNYLLNRSNYKNRYRLIEDGDKVCFYYAKDGPEKESLKNVFCYLHGEFPLEFAPDIDRDVMFAKMLIEPLNRIMVAIGHKPIPHSLTISYSFL